MLHRADDRPYRPLSSARTDPDPHPCQVAPETRTFSRYCDPYPHVFNLRIQPQNPAESQTHSPLTWPRSTETSRTWVQTQPHIRAHLNQTRKTSVQVSQRSALVSGLEKWPVLALHGGPVCLGPAVSYRWTGGSPLTLHRRRHR